MVYTDAAKVLSSRSSFLSPTFIRPDQTPDEWAEESILLKERWSLITQNIDCKRIKIRNTSI